MDMLQATPNWVFLVFFIILYYGVTSCFKHSKTKRSILTTVILFILWALYSLYANGYYTPSVVIFSFSVLLGSFFAVKTLKKEPAKFNNSNNSLEVNGSPLMLIIYLSIFSANYIVGYQKAISSEINNNYIFGMHFISGVFLGFILIKSKRLINVLDCAAKKDQNTLLH